MKNKLALYIDHTNLKPDAVTADIEKICREAVEFGFASVCVQPWYIGLAASLLRGTEVKTGSVAGFPLGANLSGSKAAEVRENISAGAEEIDMVMNMSAFKSGEYTAVGRDIGLQAEICRGAGVVLKVIIETVFLSDEEKERACSLVVRAGADYVKTATGFSGGGATVADVALMKKRVAGSGVKVKAAGGIRTASAARALIEAGADRIGTSSGVTIAWELEREYH